MSKLVTRKPTGKAPWPMVLVEGSEKSGKSWAWAAFTASPRVGRVVVCIVGETDGDAYAAIPGANYEIIKHNGTYRSILAQLQAAASELDEVDGKPPVLVLDNISSLWSQITDDAQATANAREARRNNGRMPDNDVQITMDLWNQAANRWRAVMESMMGFKGIVIVIGRGKEVASLDGSGKPTKFKDYKVEGHKTLTFDVDVIVRALGLSGKNTWDAQLVGARSVKVGISPTMNRTLPNWSLENVIFDVLMSGQDMSPARSFTPSREDIDEAAPKPTAKKTSTKAAPKVAPKPPAELVDYSADEAWQNENRRFHAITDFDRDLAAETKSAFKRSKGVESIKNISPGELKDFNDWLNASKTPDAQAKRMTGLITKYPAVVATA